MQEKICCVAGYQEIPADKLDCVRRELERELGAALEDGYRSFITGFVEGVGMLFARLVNDQREKHPDIFLEAVLHPKDCEWFSRAQWELLSKSESIKVLCEECQQDLWMSRQSGTWCYPERDVYLKDTSAFNTWNGYATILGDINSYMSTVVVQDRILAFAVDIKGVENGRVKGDIYELDYRNHVREVNRAALPLHTVTATYKDGATFTLPHKEHDVKHMGLYHQHGQLQTLIPHPEDAGALSDILKQARDKREKDARPAVFKLRTSNQKPSIRKQLAADMAAIAAAPKKATVKSKSNVMEV